MGGFSVRILVRNPEKIKNDPDFQGVEIFEGDLLDLESLEQACADVDKVIHCAAFVSFRKADRDKMRKVNIEGTANLVNVCLDRKIQKLVHVSSIAALGRTQENELITEKTQWKAEGNNSRYAISKYRAEIEVHRGVAEGLPAVVALPGLILGPGEWDKGTARIFRMMARGFPFYNTGSNGFVGVQDVAAALIRMMESDFREGEKFILVSQNITYQLLLSLIAQELGKKPPFIAVTGFWAKLLGRISEAWAGITGKHPVLTYETARTSSHRYIYDGSLYARTFQTEYQSIESVIKETAKEYLRTHGNKN